MTDTKTFRHIKDRQEWMFSEKSYKGRTLCSVEVRDKADSFCKIYPIHSKEAAKAISYVPEMLQLLHEIMFIEGIGSKYYNQIHNILCDVYGLNDE